MLSTPNITAHALMPQGNSPGGPPETGEFDFLNYLLGLQAMNTEKGNGAEEVLQLSDRGKKWSPLTDDAGANEDQALSTLNGKGKGLWNPIFPDLSQNVSLISKPVVGNDGTVVEMQDKGVNPDGRAMAETPMQTPKTVSDLTLIREATSDDSRHLALLKSANAEKDASSQLSEQTQASLLGKYIASATPPSLNRLGKGENLKGGLEKIQADPMEKDLQRLFQRDFSGATTQSTPLYSANPSLTAALQQEGMVSADRTASTKSDFPFASHKRSEDSDSVAFSKPTRGVQATSGPSFSTTEKMDSNSAVNADAASQSLRDAYSSKKDKVGKEGGNEVVSAAYRRQNAGEAQTTESLDSKQSKRDTSENSGADGYSELSQLSKTGHGTMTAAAKDASLSNEKAVTVSELFSRVGSMVHNGGGKMTVSLNPPHLGEVEIQVTTRGKKVEIDMKSGSSEAKTALESRIGDLKQSMQSQDLVLSKIEVHVSRETEHFQGAGQFSAFNGGSNPFQQSHGYSNNGSNGSGYSSTQQSAKSSGAVSQRTTSVLSNTRGPGTVDIRI